MQDLDGIVFLILLIIAAIAAWESTPWWGNEITRYAVEKTCEPNEQNELEDCTWETVPMVAFSINSNTQTVIAHPPPKSDETFEKFNNCVVAGVKNWSCTRDLVSFGFKEGDWFAKEGWGDEQRGTFKIIWWIKHFSQN